MTQALNFQSIILKLQQFWADYGCVIWQPYHTEVGAGTNNPATILRVLGPEPWNVAYVEPSIRPDDGRYGENPNRLHQHYQFQVILKPDPGNPQELYLQSLMALGIDPRQHDIRFVEDNWESPALGAWGLGWEVWLDGQEITQFTYFQQAGGLVLEPVSVEITYGLERIAIALQQVRGFRNIQWSPAVTYGDVNLQNEQEHSKYDFEIADVERLRQLYNNYQAEAESCLQNHLVLPALDYVLKCSHTFNVLDTRGAVGVTERQALFSRMRDLSKRVAEAYLEQRTRLEFPMLKDGVAAQPAASAGQTETPAVVTAPADFLLEIGSEELPAADLEAALAQLGERLPALLSDLRLAHGGVEIYGTPRRQVALVRALSPQQADLEQVFKGPPADRAFDAAGNPTPAAQGFARGKNVPVESLQVREMDGGRYVVAQVRQVGRSAQEVLPAALTSLVAGLKFEKSMRWNQTNSTYSRPLRWLVALFGEQVVPFEYAGARAGRVTRGLRFRQPEAFSLAHPAAYFEVLRSQGILLDVEQRRAVILEQVQALAAEVGGRVPDDPALLAEVTNLVEAPTALRGEFEAEYLELPREVLVGVMKKHQRYFPVYAAGDGAELLPYFIAVRNGDDQHLATVTDGNAAVIRARFADAAYFVRADRKLPLEAYLPRLKTLIFQAKLGSMLDKSQRVKALCIDLQADLNLPADEQQTVLRAAELCKADLATNMVVEMTALQGVMGRYYASLSGEPPAVAGAIFEHYLPRYAGDASPSSRAGLVVGLADRLDTLAGLFAVGLAPTGAKDPFALRRAALGLVQNLLAWDLDLDLQAALRLAARHLPARADADELDACLTFIVERLRNLLLDQGYRYDVVDAVLNAQGRNPAAAARAIKELSAQVSQPGWSSTLPAFARCVRITRDKTEAYEVLPEALVEPQEQALYQAIRQAKVAVRRAGSVADFLAAFTPLIPVINAFFDAVLVMAEDPILRANRLGMLQMVASLADGVADFTRLEGF